MSVVVSLAGGGVAAAAVGFASSAFVAASLWVLVGATIAVTNVAGRSLRQMLTPNHLLGRVISASRMIGYGTIPLGAALGGWLADAFSLRVPFFVGGGLTFVSAVVLARSMRERRIERARARMRASGW